MIPQVFKWASGWCLGRRRRGKLACLFISKRADIRGLRPTAPAKLYDIRSEVQDDVIEVNLEAEAEPRPTYVSQNLSSEMAEAFVNLLQEYKDCNTLKYSERPDLDRKMVEHQLPIKQGFKPTKQPP